MLEVAAVIPAHNEEQRIGRVVRAALRSELVDCVVVVDDGSTDGTEYAAHEAAAIEAANKTTTPFAVVSNSKNIGKTESVYKGVMRARDIGGSAINTLVFLDADSSPKWSRDTSNNMKLWQVPLRALPLSSKEPVPPNVAEDRNEAFIFLLSKYIDELAGPVKERIEDMRTGTYERNPATDWVMHVFDAAGHAGNRAISATMWDSFRTSLEEHGVRLDPWELEGALNAYADITDARHGKIQMSGVVNVGSRVKAGGLFRGLYRMNEIHVQALSGSSKVHTIARLQPGEAVQP